MVPDRDAPLRPSSSSSAETVASESTASVVAVVRSDNRRGAVAEALALLDPEIRPILSGPAVVLAQLDGTGSDPGPLSSVLDVVLSGAEGGAVLASGDRHASRWFDRRGYRAECWGRAVRFLDLPRDEERWRPVERPGSGTIRISATVADAGCRIALTPIARIRASRGGSACRRATLAAIHPDDRARFDGVPIRRAWPDLSIVEGPIGRFGRGGVVAIAGIDPTAVDAVVASVLGGGQGRGGPFGEPMPFALVGDPVEPPPGPARTPALRLARGFRRDLGHGDAPVGGS